MSKFYRGKSTLFDVSKHSDGLYFATDVNELYVGLNNGSYRVYGSKEIITNIAFDSENAKLILTYRDNVIPVKNENEETVYTNVAYVSLASLVNPVINEVTQSESGLMSATDKAYLDTLVAAYENNELGKVQGIAESEKILDLSDEGILSATINLSYDEDSKTIKLLGKNNADLGSIDATPFIKDGMLQNVEIITDEETNKKYIEFTWNITIETEIEGEKVETTKTDRVAIDDIVVAYTAGNGIEISDTNQISVKAGSGITVDANGVAVKLAGNAGDYKNPISGDTNDIAFKKDKNFLEMDNDSLRMPGVTTDYTVLQEDIIIAGLSSSGIGAGVYKNGQTIHAGTSIYEILSNILSKESYPAKNSGTVSGPSFKTTYGTPSYSVMQGETDVNGTTVEVGTLVTITSVSGTAPSASGKRTYSGFTNGYATVDEDGTANIVRNQNPPEVAVVASSSVSSGTFTLSRSFSDQKFGQTTGSSSTSSEGYDKCSISDLEVSVREGTNKVTCTMTGPVHTGSINASPKYYVLSNKFNYKEESGYYVVAQSANSSMTATVTNGTSTKTVTGAFYYYIGYADAIPTNIPVTGDTEDHATTAIKGLDDLEAKWCISTGNTITTGGTLPGGKNMCIAVPSHYKLDSIMNGFDLESKESFATSSVKYKLGDGTYQDYTIYSMNSAADWNFKTIKITKA